MYGVGVQLSLPLELAVSKLQTIVEDAYFQDSIEKRIMHLMKIEEERDKLIDRILEHQLHVKKFLDKRARPKNF